MKRYTIALLLVTILLVLVSFGTLWVGQGIFRPILAVLPLYFALVTWLMHNGIVRSFYKDPRTFVKNFLGLTVCSLVLHLAVLTAWSFTHLESAKVFVIGFCVCYLVYLVFETVALIMVVQAAKKKQQEKD